MRLSGYFQVLIWVSFNWTISVTEDETAEIARERMKIIIAPKSESCFFIPKLLESNVLNVRWIVISFKDGKQQDVTFRMKD